MKQKNRIGISGGTFDPIHHGHLIMAELAREKFKLDKVLFIPTGNPPHKNNLDVTPAEQRYNMVCRATESNDYFETLRTEIDRVGYTYAVDTLNELRQAYGKDTEFYYIIGADVVFDLLNWKNSKEVLRLCEFIAVQRPGFEKERFADCVRKLQTDYGAVVHTLNMPQIEISSTGIRERVSRGGSVKYLVPESVEECILNQGLYRKL